MAMAVAPAGDGQRSRKLAAALSRTSAAFLFFSVVAVGVVFASARWITTATTVSCYLKLLNLVNFVLGLPYSPSPSETSSIS
jgi:hypothetical protein